MSKEVNQEEYAPRTIADVKEMLSKHSNGEIQRTIRNCELIRQKGKEQVKEKARDSVLQLLNRLQAEQIQRKPSVPPVAEKSETRGDVY